MKFHILQSKIQVPELNKTLIIREHLLKEIDKSQEKMLIFHGTVGYGKTVLMCEFIRLYEYPCVWYHLDEMDNDLYTFLEYLIAGFQKIWPAFQLDAARDPVMLQKKVHRHQMELELINSLNDCLERESGAAHKTVLILDDFQEIYNKQIFSLIHLLIEATSSRLQIFLATKSSLPDFTAGYLLREKVKIFEMEELAFSQHEVCCVLEKVMSQSVSDSMVAHVYHEVEGWPAGTMFLAQYLRQARCDKEHLDWERVSNEAFIQEYLLNELYAKLPYDIQQFLVRSAVLDEISVGLCNYALNITNARSNLDYLLQEDLFILRINKGSGYYRYHSMFRMFLQRHINPCQRMNILERAAEYYLRNHHLDRCMECYVQSENWPKLLHCVLQYGADFIKEGQITVLQQCIAVLQEQKQVAVTPEQCRQLDDIQQAIGRLENGTPAPAIQICFFGTFRVLLGEERHPLTWRTKKTAELFACLAERQGKAICRNDLLKLLWPDSYPNNAVAMLHNMLYSIRKELAPFGQNERIQYINKEYFMEMEGISCDLHDIQALCQAVEKKDIPALEQHQEHFMQYWGAYLEGIDNEWCQAQKYYYERCFLNGCLLLGRYLMEQRHFAQAKAVFTAGLEVDIYSEPLAVGLMHCYAEGQERKECKRFYENFCKLYQNDLGIAPSDNVKQVYEQCICKRY